MTQQIIYSDLNLNLLDIDSDILVNEDAIKQQLLLRFTFFPKSRVKARDFGSNLETLLWEPVDGQTASDIRVELMRMAGDDGRLVVKQGTVLPDIVNQQYYVDFDFYCPVLKKDINLNFNLSKLLRS